MSSRNLRVGLIGAGMMGKNHARVVRDIDGADLVVVADQQGDPHGVAKGIPLVSGLQEALTYDLDCAIVAVPTRLHEEIGVHLASQKVPTLIEKPLAGDPLAAARIADAFRETGTVGSVGHIERFNPAVQELQRRLAAGDLGEIFQIATRRQSSFPGRISDVGVAKDLATHDVDLTMAISASDYVSVSAFTAHRSGRDTEDMIVASGTLANGAIVNHVVNWLSPLKERAIVVTGDSGIFVADTLTGDLTLHRNGQFAIDWDSLSSFRGVSEGDVTRFAYPKKEPLKAQLEAFFAAVSSGETHSIASLADGLRVVEVVERLLESATSGAIVSATASN